MDDTRLRCFLSLARTLNFTQTAEEVFLTQQAVSRSIAALEKELELQLFQRSTRSVRLTPEGVRFLAMVERMGGEFQQTLIQLRRQQRPLTLHVGYQNFLLFHDELRQALSDLREESPDITLNGDRFCPPLLRKLLRQGQLDMAVAYRRFFPGDEQLRSLPLCGIPQYFMVSPDLPPRGDDPLADLRRRPFLIDRFEHETRQEFAQRVQMERELWGFTGETVVVPDRDSAYTYAELGRGVVIGTGESVMAAGRALASCPTGVRETLHAVWPLRDPSPLAARYARFLQRAFSQRHSEVPGAR